MNKSQKNHKKGLVLLFKTNDFVRTIDYIEAICNELNFDIIKIDEQKDKIAKLNKISEATQSHKIMTVSNAINEKIKIVTNIVQNNPQNCNVLQSTYGQNGQTRPSLDIIIPHIDNSNDKKFQNSNNNSIFKSKEDISEEASEENNFDNNLNTNLAMKEPISGNMGGVVKNGEVKKMTNDEIKEKISLLTDNIYKISANKKTLILIPDNFEDLEDEKSFYNNLCSKSINTKCPFIILTSKF